MNKFFLPLFLIISSVVFGQGNPMPTYQMFGNSVTLTDFKGAPRGVKGIVIGRYTDTTTANNNAIGNYIKFYPGAFIVTDNPRDEIWQRNYNATAWINRGSFNITTFNFLTDSSLVICFGNNICDTISFTNNVFVTNNDNTVTVFNDSTLIVCSTPVGGPPVCDTISFAIDSINNFYFLNDSTIIACDTPQVICVGDSCYTQQVCDTISVPRRNSLILQNGLQFIAPGIGVFGNPAEGSNPSNLQYDTYLHTDYYQLSVEGKPALRPPLNVKQIQWNTISGSVASFHHLGPNIYQYPNAIDVENPIKLYIGYTNLLWADSIGFMDDRIGYLMGTNINGNFYSFSPDKAIGKQSGLMYHTLDTAYKDAVTIWGNQTPLRYNFGNTPFPSTTLLDSRIAVFKTDKEVQIPGYPSTRNDGGTAKALYTDATGNIRLGPVTGGDIITIINDTTINICSFGTQLCDTIIINNIGVIQNVFVLNDSTLVVCDTVGVCDTIIINPTVISQPITANNGLIMSTPTNVQLGSPQQPGAPLLHQTYINAGSLYSLNINGNVGGTNWVFAARNTGTGSAIVGEAVSGDGVVGIAMSGVGGAFRATSGIGITATSFTSFAGIFTINPITTNTVAPIISLQRQVQGTAGNGVGQSINFVSQTSDGVLWASNQVISKWTTVNTATRVSQYIITGVNNAITADLFTLSGSGQTRLNKYGINTFAGTPVYDIGVDANGNLVEFAVPSGSGLLFARTDASNATGNSMYFDNSSEAMLWDNITSMEMYANTFIVQNQAGTIQRLIVSPTQNNLISPDGSSSNINQANGFIEALQIDGYIKLNANETAVGVAELFLDEGNFGISADKKGTIGVTDSLIIGGLTNYSLQDRLIGQKGSSQRIGYITIGTGLSLSSGVLSATGTTYTFNNGITESVGTVQLGSSSAPGSALLHDSYINAGAFILKLNSTTNGVNTFQVTSSGTNATAITGTGGAYGAIFTGTSTAGVAGISDGTLGGVYGATESGRAGYFRAIQASTNTVYNVLEVANRAFTASASGIGVAITYSIGTTIVGNFATSNQLISKWTTPTDGSPTSQFIITGVDAATTRTLAKFDGNGMVTFPGEGTPSITTFSQNTSGIGILSSTTSGISIWGESTSNLAVYGQSTYNGAVAQFINTPSSTNTVITMLDLRRASSGTGAAGNGQSIDFYSANSTGAGSVHLANQLISKLTTATAGAEVSQFIITGVNSATTQNLLSLAGSGQLTLDQYTISNFKVDDTTNYKPTVVDANGVVYRFNHWPSGGAGGTAWSGITDPTTDLALTFQAGESTTMTDQNTTEDHWTVNNATSTTNSIYSINRTSTALGSGNNMMELLSSGANASSSITSNVLRIDNKNTGTGSINNGILLDVSGGATNNAINITAGSIQAITGSSSQRSIDMGSVGLYNVSGAGIGIYHAAASGFSVFVGETALIFKLNTAVIDFGQVSTFGTTNRIRISTPAEGTVKFHSLGLTAETIIQSVGGEGAAGTVQLWADEGDDNADKFSISSTIGNILQFANNTTNLIALPSTGGVSYTSNTLVSAAAGLNEYNGSFYQTKASTLRYAQGGVIADFTADANNSGTGETDLYSYTTPASTLAATGEKLEFSYTITLSDITSTAQIQVYFAGTAIGNTGALTVSATGAVIVSGYIIRTGASTARASVNISSPTASTAVYTAETDLTSLTFTNTNILKVTGTAGGAGGGSNDITGKLGWVKWFGAANN